MAYKRLTQDEYIIQGDYGQGWEDVTAESTRKECKERLKEYRQNEPMYSHRMIVKRVRIEQVA